MRSCVAVVILSTTLLAMPGGASSKLKVIDGRPVVETVFVNGHGPFRFLLDTGTTANHLDRKLAESIGLKATFRSKLVSSAGAIDAPGAEGVEVRLDTTHAAAQRFLFTGGDVLHRLAPDIQGILGQSFLALFDYRLDMQAKRIEFGTRQPAFSEICAPLRVSEARPLVSTNLGILMIDSGTRWVALFGLDSGDLSGEMTTLSGSLRVGTVARKLLIEGHAVWHGSALAVPHAAESGAEGLLPVSLFKSVYFSNSEHYVSFE